MAKFPEYKDTAEVILADELVVRFTNNHTTPLSSDPDGKDNRWNTGLAACGCPHSDEGQGVSEVAILEFNDPFAPKRNISIRLYNNNEYLTLAPGGSFELTTKTHQEAAYYLALKNHFDRGEKIDGKPAVQVDIMQPATE